MNTFGKIFTLTTFGESHGRAIGGIIDGVPAGYSISADRIREVLSRRSPGNLPFTSSRKETDDPEILSGIGTDNVTLGSPIGFLIRNKDTKSNDYSGYAGKFRPNHADYTYFQKYGIRPQPGGGRSSARETACRVVAGAIAEQILDCYGVRAKAYISAVGNYGLKNIYKDISFSDITSDNLFCPDSVLAEKIKKELSEASSRGDSIGGKVSCIISGVPIGLGEPVYGKLQARLADAMMSINAAKGFEYGLGFKSVESFGSETADLFSVDDGGEIGILSNHSGGIQGGISNGRDICFSVAFKPTPTLMVPLQTVDIEGTTTIINPKGRHDGCLAIRAVPVIEAMANIVMLDVMLLAGKVNHFK